jgi:hypothetical protein
MTFVLMGYFIPCVGKQWMNWQEQRQKLMFTCHSSWSHHYCHIWHGLELVDAHAACKDGAEL